jgi:L-fuculose-phosphate aldolase
VDPQQAIALGCRILSRVGQDHFVYGHLSARLDDGSIAIKAAGVPMATAAAHEVARLTLDGVNLTPQLRVHDETVMHLAVYRSRPEITAVVHTHPIYSHAASLHGPPEAVYSQDQVVFAGSLSFYDSALLVNSPESAADFALCLGQNRAALLRAHGLLTVGESVEEAVVLAVLLERAMQILVTARAAGPAVSPMHDTEVDELRALFERSHSTRMRDVWEALTR